MNIYALIGVCCGIAVGLVICIAFFAIGNTNGKLRTEYDERQQIIRGKSYTVGFYSMLIAAALMCVLSMGEIEVPIENAVLYFILLFVGIMSMVIHSVWNGVYWGLNNKKGSYLALFVICTVFNLGSGIMACVHGTMIREGKISTPFIYILCGLIFIIVGAVMVVRSIYDKKLEGED